ncbi:MAG: FimV/HubP family polar landmark protein [Actinomycetota bacterium]
MASCLSMTPWLAEAAGLGKITVLSNLGQPLRAEVEIGANRDELGGMTVRLAPVEAFKQAGIDYASNLSDLRFTLDKRPNGSSVVRISSSKPVNEPFLDFLLELNWPAGRLVREYTFLLDPPEVAAKSAGKAVSVAEAKPVVGVRGGGDTEPTPAAKPAAKEATTAKAEPKPEVKPAPKPKAAESEEKKPESAGTRVVKQGETLRKIVGETQYEGVSLEQMLVGVYRANADAFIGNNINRLKAGAILNLPEKETVAAIPQGEAKKVYLAQAADWNAYRRKLAAAAAQGPARDDAGGQSSGGKITAKVEEKAAPAEMPKDQVKVSRTDASAKAAAVGSAKAEENLVAKEKALKEAQERLALLEKNVNDLQKLVEMKNQSLAEMQKQAAAKKPEEQKAPAVPVKPVEPVKVPEPPKAVEPPKPVEAAKPVEPPKPAEAPKVEEAPKPVEPPKAAEEPKPAEGPKPAEPPKPVVKKPVVLPEPEPEPSLVDDLLENPLPLVGGLGGILALLGGYLAVKRRRQKAAELSMVSPSAVSIGPNSVFRATGGQSVDTGNTTPQTTDFSQTGPGTIDTDEVDPVAEADVYMAYGRDAQAEEILLEALQKDPQRTAIHVKLLEIYAGRKSLKQFETLASELYAQTAGSGPEWEKVAAMGVRLDPSNPLYSGGSKGGAEPAAESFDADATLVISPEEAARNTMILSQPVAQPEAAPTEADTAASLDLNLATHAPEMEALIPAGETKPEAELMSLDFDLGLAAPEPAAAEAAPAAEIPAPDVGALDFDLDLASQADAPAAQPVSVEVADTAAVPEAHALDFDLDIGLPAEEPVVAPVAEAVAEIPAAPAVDMPESLMETVAGLESTPAASASPEVAVTENMLDFDLDIGSPAVEPAIDLSAPAEAGLEVAAPESMQSIDIGAVDTGGLDFDIQLPDSSQQGEVVEAPSFDIGAISLDLGGEAVIEAPEVQMVEPAVEAVPDVAAEEPVFAMDAPKDPHWEEVNTKLDLAKAYEEMGDLEGARELLQEVLGEGTEDLVEQAKGILERIEA